MKGMRAVNSFLILTALVSVAALSSYAETSLRDKAKSIPWTYNNADALKQLIPDNQSATTFVRLFFPDAALEPQVGEFGFVKLDNTEGLSYVASLDWSGRQFYTTILVIRKTDGNFTTQEIHTGGANVSHLFDSIVDLHGDGEKQILVPRLLGSYAGATPTPSVSDVYRWNGKQFEKANNKFKDYYVNTVLPQLESALTNLKRGPSTAGPETKQKLTETLETEISEVRKIINN